MAGKKTIAYPIELKFVTRTPYFFNGAKDKYDLHKDEIDNILHLLEGEYQVGYEHLYNAYRLRSTSRISNFGYR